MAIRKTKPDNKPINFVIGLAIYPFDVMVSISQSDAELGKSLDPYGKLPIDEIEGCRYSSDTCKARYVMFSMGASLIRLRHLPTTPSDYGTLAHEIAHVSMCLMERIGMELKCGVSDEAYTYLIGYLTESIYKRINQYY